MSGFVPSLWGVAVALYAWECLIAVPRDRLAIASRGWHYRALPGRALPGTATRGFWFGNPLPPFGLVFLLGDPPGALSRKPKTDFHQVRQRLDHVSREVLPLNVAGALSFVAIFVALPVAEAMRVTSAVAPWLFGVVLLSHVASLVLRRRALRRLGLRSTPSDTLLVAASPLQSLRVGATVAARAYDGFEPLAVGLVLLQAPEFLELARQRLEDPGTIEAAHRVMRAAGVDPTELDGQPLVEDDAARGFCPACRTFFTIESGACSDCGTELQPLDEARRSAGRRLIASVEQRSREIAL